jgi:multiple sugar transport system substrate-binding protein
MSDGDRSVQVSRGQVLAMGAAGAAALFLPGCGGGDTKKKLNESQSGGGGGGSTYDGPAVKLAFWNGFTGGDGPYMQRLVKRFNGEHKNITVVMNKLEWANYYQKVPAAVNAGKGPDLGIMHIDQLATNAARQVIIPLDDVAQSLKLAKNDFAAEVWDGGVYNGDRYGIPLDTHPLGFYYNKKLMQQAGIDAPPETKADFEAALQKMSSKGIKSPFWMPATWPAHLIFMSLLWQFGGELVNADGTEATFNSAAGKQALSWMLSMQQKGFSPKNVAPDSQYVAFKNEKNAFTWDGIWQINDLKTVPGLEWDAAPLPQIGDQKAVWASSHNFVIMKQRSADDNKLQASKVFINWISQHSIDWARAGQIPARNTVRNSAAFKALPQQSALAQQISYVHFPPALPGWGDVSAQTLEQAVTAAVQGKSTADKALDAGVSKANQLLKENKKKYGG